MTAVPSPTLASLLQFVAALAFAPLLPGLIQKTKAVFAGRTGAPVVQPYSDLAKLLRKRYVFSTVTTGIFRAGPVVSAAAAVAALALVPLAGVPAAVRFSGDLVALVYLLALGRFFTAAAALDTGSSFEGMGASRDLSFACLAEPAFLFGLIALVRLSGSFSLTGMLSLPASAGWRPAGASLALVGAGWFFVLLAENCRIPFDDPNTHLELTMIHEVMVLDHGGPALGVSLYGAWVRLFVFEALVVRLLLPGAARGPWAPAVFLAGMLFLCVVIGAVESAVARVRLAKAPLLLVTACLLCGFGVVMAWR